MCRRMLVGLILAVAWPVAPADALELAAGGNSRYRIVVADEPAPSVRAAAEELAAHLSQVTGATFPIVNASDAEGDHLILVGPSAALDKLELPIHWPALEPEGFVIRTVGSKLVITGPGQGTINGVYTFLEETVGCQWYAPDYTLMPSRPDLDVGELAIRYLPPFESRLIISGSARDVAWSARQRLNTFTGDVLLKDFLSDPRTASCIYYAVAHVHTLSPHYLLNGVYDRNPEFFALRDGKRVRGGQACLANPGLFEFIVKRAGQWIRSDPGARIIGISGNDFAGECQCPLCQAEYKKHGLAGTYMQFVNRVAERLEAQFPDILVSTLAYHATRVLPPGVKMRRNVVIRYCTQNSYTCYYHSLDGCELNNTLGILKNMGEWVGAAPRVWVWYYLLPRTELLPYPSLNSLSRNFKLMRDAGVKGFFMQTTMAGPGARHGGLGDLQSYLLAKLTWNPDYDVAAGTQRFVNDCYGAAAEHILEYVKTVNAEPSYAGYSGAAHIEDRFGSKKDQLHATYGGNMMLKRKVVEHLDALFDEAERAVADDSVLLQRVKYVRLSLQLYLIYYSQSDDPLRVKAMGNFFPIAREVSLALVYSQKKDQWMSVDEFEKFCNAD